MIHWVVYDILRDVLWTSSFPVWEEGQAGCGDVLAALAFVSVSQFGSVWHPRVRGRARAFWSSCPPSPYHSVLTGLIKDVTSLQDLPFLYPWAAADTAVTVGICWMCRSCEPSLDVFFPTVAGI